MTLDQKFKCALASRQSLPSLPDQLCRIGAQLAVLSYLFKRDYPAQFLQSSNAFMDFAKSVFQQQHQAGAFGNFNRDRLTGSDDLADFSRHIPKFIESDSAAVAG